MTDKKTISVYDSQVEKYVELINQQPVDELLLDFISQFNANDFILDLGCGPAISSATMREHGLRVDPTDASIEMVNLANETFDINARQALFEDINTKNIYDGIWANFSLLHATHEELPAILKSLHASLKHKGRFHMGMKLGQDATRDKMGRYYSYCSEDDLRSHLSNAGFSVQEVKLGEALGMAGNMEPWIALSSTS